MSDGPFLYPNVTSLPGQSSIGQADRQPKAKDGKKGEFDSGSLYMGQGMSRKGDELWQYYGGSVLRHDEVEFDKHTEPDFSRVYSRVVSRLDGFVSVDADQAADDQLAHKGTRAVGHPRGKEAIQPLAAALGQRRVVQRLEERASRHTHARLGEAARQQAPAAH